MLVRHDVVFVLRVRRLVLRRDVDGFAGQMRGPIEFLEGSARPGPGKEKTDEGEGKGRESRVGWAGGGVSKRKETHFEEVSVAGLGKVDVGVGGVFGL